MAKIEIAVPDDVVRFAESTASWNRYDLMKHFGVTEFKAKIYAHILKKGKVLKHTVEEESDRIKTKYNDTSGELEVNSYTIHTLEQALDIANVDLDKWKVDRWVCNSWQVTMKIKIPGETDDIQTRTNYQVKVWLKPKIAQPLEIALRKIADKFPKYEFNRVPEFTAPTGVAVEMALLDAHFGKLAWAMETQRRDYTLKHATRDYLIACEQNLSWAKPFEPEKIFFIVGQDLMHTENYMGVTPKARHVLDTDSRLPKIFEVALETTIKCIIQCRDVAPVEVIWIPGNHDMHASMFLCVALSQAFGNDPYVTVDVTPAQRKARLWGKLLVGWTHELPVSRTTAWVNELAHAFPDLWGQSEWREWHHGHKHKKSEIKSHPVLTQGGVVLRQLTALSPIDAWHYENMFTDAVPGGEAFVWSKKRGVIANFTAWTEIANIKRELQVADEPLFQVV